jgi:hypothetical protein
MDATFSPQELDFIAQTLTRVSITPTLKLPVLSLIDV